MNPAPFPAPALSLPARLLALPFRVLALLPFSLLHVAGACLGTLLYLLLGRRRHIGLVNLRLCFPEWDDARQRQVLRQHFRQLATCIFAYGHVWFAGRARFTALVRHEGYAHYAAAVATGRPIILLVPHFLGLDAGGIRLSVDHQGCSMYSASHENAFDELLLAGRSRFGSTLLIRRNDGIRAIIKALREPRSFYYLPDQDLGPRESIFVPFFGVPTATVPALGKLAKLADAIVIPMVTTLDKDGFVSRFHPGWEDFPSGDEVVDTTRMNAFIESSVREHPSQYYWLHRRFKTRPEGEPGVY